MSIENCEIHINSIDFAQRYESPSTNGWTNKTRHQIFLTRSRREHGIFSISVFAVGKQRRGTSSKFPRKPSSSTLAGVRFVVNLGRMSSRRMPHSANKIQFMLPLSAPPALFVCLYQIRRMRRAREHNKIQWNLHSPSHLVRVMVPRVYPH